MSMCKYLLKIYVQQLFWHIVMVMVVSTPRVSRNIMNVVH